MRILQHLIIAVPVALLWIALTSLLTVESFIIGYIVGVTLSWLLAQGQVLPPLSTHNLPGRAFTFILYSIKTAWDIFLSGVDVTLRILGIRQPKPGIIAVPVQHGDEDDPLLREVMAGLSAHSITITPGELVVDYSEDGEIMYVHVLDIDSSAPKLDDEQAARMRIFRKVFGRDRE